MCDQAQSILAGEGEAVDGFAAEGGARQDP